MTAARQEVNEKENRKPVDWVKGTCLGEWAFWWRHQSASMLEEASIERWRGSSHIWDQWGWIKAPWIRRRKNSIVFQEGGRVDETLFSLERSFFLLSSDCSQPLKLNNNKRTMRPSGLAVSPCSSTDPLSGRGFIQPATGASIGWLPGVSPKIECFSVSNPWTMMIPAFILCRRGPGSTRRTGYERKLWFWATLSSSSSFSSSSWVPEVVRLWGRETLQVFRFWAIQRFLLAGSIDFARFGQNFTRRRRLSQSHLFIDRFR